MRFNQQQRKNKLFLRTVFEVPQSFFTVTLLTVAMETLDRQTLQTQVTGQVVSPEMTSELTNTSEHNTVKYI